MEVNKIIIKMRSQEPESPSAASPAARWLHSSSDTRAQQHYLGASLPFSNPTAFGKPQNPPQVPIFFRPPLSHPNFGFHTRQLAVPPPHTHIPSPQNNTC